MARSELGTVARQPISTGVPGLDQVLHGGLTPDRFYVIEGTPGCGKTTLGLQFLLEGVSKGEKGIFLSPSETREELEEVAASHGWDLSGISIVESAVSERSLNLEEQATMFQSSEMELSETTRRLLEEVEKVKPARVVFDSLSELRLLAQNPLRHRQQIVALKHYFIPRGCTVLMLNAQKNGDVDIHLQTASHGSIQLERMPPEYGAERYRLRVLKMRGRDFTLGWHDFVIRTGGIVVFPRLISAEHPGGALPEERVISGLKELDRLVGGGPTLGTSTLIMGPAGTGKSPLACQYAIACAERGGHVSIFSFDENLATILRRSKSLGMRLQEHLDAGRIHIESVDPGQISPGEFANWVQQAAQPPDGHQPSKLIIIDSLNGYMNAMPEERFLLIQLHEMLSYLGHHGVATMIVVAQHGLVGTGAETPVDTTYLADNAILLRFFEAAGQIKRAISVVKMRSGKHEDTIRELQLDSTGVHVGEPLHQFQGVLTGEPTFLGGTATLMQRGT